MKNNWIIGLILAILLATIAVVFALQNDDKTEISFLTWDLELPLALVIISSFIIGAVTALLFTVPSKFKKRKRISILKKENIRLSELVNKAKDNVTSIADQSTTSSSSTQNI